METLLTETVGQIALAIAGIILVVALVTYIQVRSMSNPKLRPYTASGNRGDSRIEATRVAREWAQQNDFKFMGYYLFQANVFIAAWQREDRPMFFCYYLAQNKKLSDLVTLFGNEVSLTTGSSMDGQFFPLPENKYMQSFSRLHFDDLWDRHVAMENYLIDEGGAELVELDLDFQESILKAIQDQMKYVRSIPLWPLRGLWWFAVRRFRWHNLTIRQQREKDWIRLPKEYEAQWTVTAR